MQTLPTSAAMAPRSNKLAVAARVAIDACHAIGKGRFLSRARFTLGVPFQTAAIACKAICDMSGKANFALV